MSDVDKTSILPPSQQGGVGSNDTFNKSIKSNEIIYKSEVMKQTLRMVERVAPSNANVLVLGESGTGKELVARAIHQKSNRSNKPFIAINCGALRETLLESELFGHERGAFTGAYSRKIGLAEVANGCLLYTSPSPRDATLSRMPSSA